MAFNTSRTPCLKATDVATKIKKRIMIISANANGGIFSGMRPSFPLMYRHMNFGKGCYLSLSQSKVELSSPDNGGGGKNG